MRPKEKPTSFQKQTSRDGFKNALVKVDLSKQAGAEDLVLN